MYQVVHTNIQLMYKTPLSILARTGTFGVIHVIIISSEKYALFVTAFVILVNVNGSGSVSIIAV